MALSSVIICLFAGCCLALENPQVFIVPQRCDEDTNTFLWEINQETPKEYAVISKCFCLPFAFYTVDSGHYLEIFIEDKSERPFKEIN